jgi:hypothetical protein
MYSHSTALFKVDADEAILCYLGYNFTLPLQCPQRPITTDNQTAD